MGLAGTRGVPVRSQRAPVDPAPYAEREPGSPLGVLNGGPVTRSAHQVLSRGWLAVRERGVLDLEETRVSLAERPHGRALIA
jgi:hypothetical protein